MNPDIPVPTERRERVISFRVTEEEYDELHHRAKLRGLRLSDLLRQAGRSSSIGSESNTHAFAGLHEYREVRYGR